VPAARPLHADPIDHLLALDPGGRGIAAFFQPGGALAAARALARAPVVLIATGFVVAEGMPETDGPPGAAVLGRALRRLGAHVRYTTDPAALPPLEASLRVLGEPPDAFAYPDAPDAAAAVLARERPTHLVAIERPGRGRSGDYLNARGISVRQWNRPIDEMFVLAQRSGTGRSGRGRSGGWTSGALAGRPDVSEPPPSRPGHPRFKPSKRHPLQQKTGLSPQTIAIGDGGNEIGMGRVYARLAREGRLMARIACVVPADHLVVAGVSNWGAYGIVAQLGRLTGRALLHTPAEERRLIEACVAAGAADGITRLHEPTVDGLGTDTHASVVALLGLSWGRLRGERT
jgi:hypothetical protein